MADAVAQGGGAAQATRSGARAGRKRRLSASTIGWPVLAIAIMVGAWEAISRFEIVDPIILPAPSEIVSALVGLAQQAFFWEALWVTMKETFLGFAIGCGVAWLLGTLISLSLPLRHALYPLAIGFQNTPRIALAPVFLTWFGFGITSKVMLAAAICFFPVLIAVVVGLDTVDGNARRLMRSFGASRWQTYWKLGLPSSLPIVFAGLKTAMSLALVGAIVAEFVGGAEGIGVLIKTFNFQLNIADAFASILVLMLIGLLLYWLLELLDRKLVFWRAK